jgi:hypothetical protein
MLAGQVVARLGSRVFPVLGLTVKVMLELPLLAVAVAVGALVLLVQLAHLATAALEFAPP